MKWQSSCLIRILSLPCVIAFLPLVMIFGEHFLTPFPHLPSTPVFSLLQRACSDTHGTVKAQGGGGLWLRAMCVLGWLVVSRILVAGHCCLPSCVKTHLSTMFQALANQVLWSYSSYGGSIELGSAIWGDWWQPCLHLQTWERKAVPSEDIVTWWLCSLLIVNILQVHYK